jgi:hypothetical protein
MKRYQLLMCLGVAFFLSSCKESPKIARPKHVKKEVKKPVRESAEKKIMKDATQKVKQLEENFIPAHIKNSSIQSVIQ